MSRRERAALAGIVALACVGLYVGWRDFWFLCDDSYIAFRYVSNSQLGFGYVWNPPPWKPVEGYSSWLFVVLMDFAWRFLGKEPPVSANTIDLLFSYGTLALLVAMALELRLTRLAPHRVAVVGLVLLGTLTNRTFLAWTSSGLETGMFGFWVMAWVYVGLFRPLDRGRLTLLTTLAGVLELSRPDGLLFLLATVAILGLDLLRRAWEGRATAADAIPWTPLAIPAVHVAWRMSFYGFPLPNTAYAKHTAPWPEMGALYLASFLVEYGYWLWLLLLAALLIRAAWTTPVLRRLRAVDLDTWVRAAVVATVVAQAAYYVLIIGGDHFEYRVLEPLVPLSYLSLAWIVDRLHVRPSRAFLSYALVLLVGWPIPWTHWWFTHTVFKTYTGGLPTHRVSDHLPAALRPSIAWWDDVQRTMIRHFVGMRHQTHIIFGMVNQPKSFPTREEGEKIRNDADPPVLVHGGVGYPAWVLPHVAILDYRGLNDAVVAHTPVKTTTKSGAEKKRVIAHERTPPAGYTACFHPNVKVAGGKVVVSPRSEPLTAEQIRDCEDRFLAKALGRPRASGRGARARTP
jgi:arabinofuranosyltransferase